MHDDPIALPFCILPRGLGPRVRPFNAKAHSGLARGGGRSAAGGAEVHPCRHVHRDAGVRKHSVLTQRHGLPGFQLVGLDSR